MITQAELKELLRYDPETGHFWWRQPGKGRRVGRPVGSVDNGYVYITLKGERLLAHRLAFLYMEGFIPDLVDHEEGQSNKWSNLREANPSLNRANSIKTAGGSSQYKGVSWITSRRKWQAAICVNGKRISLGRFESELEAAHAYRRAAEHYFGEFSRKAAGLLG